MPVERSSPVAGEPAALTASPHPDRSQLVLATVLTLAVWSGLASPADAGRISSVVPSAVSAEATVRLTGTGFAPAPADNIVTITPAGRTDGVTATVTAVSAADSAGTTRRLTVRVPSGLPAGRASVRVRNAVTGEQSDEAAIEIVDLRLSPAYLVQGTTMDVELSLAGNAAFDTSATRVSFGTGVTVNSQAVTSATRVVASVAVAATAATGPRTVGVMTPTMTAVAGVEVLVEPPPNRPPTFTSTPPLVATVGTPYAYTATATDPDGDAVSFVLVSGPAGFAIAPGGAVTWTPAANQAGSQAITIEARDGRGGNTPQSFTVTVGEVSPPPGNRPPTATFSVTPSTPAAGETVVFDAAGSTDPDGDALDFAWTFGGLPPAAGMVVTRVFPGAGTYAVTLTVRDGRGGEATVTRQVTVSESSPPPPTNRPPTFTSTPPLVATVGTPYVYTATATDPDGDAVSFVLVSGPAGLTIAPGGAVTWTPAANQVGAQEVAIEARDGRGGNTPQSFTVTVSGTPPPPPPTNRPPTAVITAPASVASGTPITFDGSGSSDPDAGDVLTYEWRLEGQVAGTAPTLTRTFTVSAETVVTVTLTVRDGRGGEDTATRQVTVTVTEPPPPPNRPPTVSFTVTPASPVAGEPASFDASTTSDPDGDDLTFSWDFGDGVPASGVQVSRVFAAPGSYTVRLTVTDTRGASVELAQTVIVGTQPNRVPTASFTVSTTSAVVGATVSFDASASTDPDGDPLTFAWSFGDANAGTGALVAHAFAAAGTFTVTLTVDDARGGTATASQTITVTVQPPQNRPPTAVITGATAGVAGVALSLDGRGSTDPDGDEPLGFSWNLGVAGGTATTPTVRFTYAEAGTYTVSLTVTDAAGGSSTATRSLVIEPAADRTPPVITLSGPTQALPGTTVTFVADASDNVGVTRVRFTVDEGAPTDVEARPYERAITLPAFAAPDQQVVVRATAFDAAGNTASATAAMTLRAVPDTEPPTVFLVVPPSAAAGARTLISARVSDDSGIGDVAFLVHGQEVARISAPPFATEFTVASDAEAGSRVPVVARATDVAGNAADDAATILVVATADTTPPTVTLEAPAEALPGERITVSAVATDDTGVADVVFSVDGAALPLQTLAPYNISYVVPPQAPAGSTLRVVATARDFAANAAQAQATVAIVAPQAITRSVVTGEVYDDTTGLPLAGVTVQLSGTSALGLPYGEQATTDARGRYTLRAVSGTGWLKVSKPGYTRVWREVTLPAGQAVEPVDARLTPLGATTMMSGLAGGTLTRGAQRLVVPPGALGGTPQVTLTAIGGQGLRALLPPGWSPLAAIDVGPDTLAFAAPASWRAQAWAEVEAGRPVVVARYDEAAQAWRAVGQAGRGADGEFTAPITRGGQHVLIVPDERPVAPPLPSAGALVPGVAAPSLDAAAQGALAPAPAVLFYRPGVFSTVTSRVVPSEATSSGLVMRATVGESYAYLSGESVTTDPWTQDLVLYQLGGSGNDLVAVHVVSPSLVFEPIELREGVISVALTAVPAGVGVPLAGPDGGTVTGQNGTALVVPPGALAEQTPLTLDTFDASGLAGLLTPAGLAIAGALQLGFEGTLQVPGALSIPQPAGLTDPSRVLLAQVLEVGGRTRLVLRALARLSGGRLVSDVTLNGAPTALEGVRGPGRYLFLRSSVPLGFAAGFVRGAGGAPFGGALVSTAAFATVSLSRGDGAYFAAAPSGPTTFVATDVARGDRGTGAATLPFNNVAPLDLSLAPQPPTVTSITPANGAVNVALSSAITVVFSKPIDRASLTAGTVTLASGATTVASSLALSSTGTVLTVRPDAPLAPNTRYTFTLAGAISDLSGNRLGQPVSVAFDSLNTVPPPVPPPGSITATIPSNGVTTVAATQGTASPRDRVTIRNLTTKQQQVALVNGDGSFSAQIAAALSHKLQIVIRDQAGNETVVDVPRYRNPDGSTVIGPEGGEIAAGDLVLTVKPGTFPNGAIVRFTPIPRQQVTYNPGPDFPFVAAFEISASVRPQIYLNVSAPVPPGTDPRTTGIVGELVTVLGEQTLDIVDTARIVDGRLTTSSPPCEGIVNKYGRYAMFLNQDERMRFGIALLSMAVPRSRPVVLQPYTLPGPGLGGALVPTRLYPEVRFDELYQPAYPMLARIYDRLLAGQDENGPPLDIPGTIGQPLNLSQLNACANDPACAQNPVRPVCAPIPPDAPTLVVVRDAQTGQLLQATPLPPTPAGEAATATAAFYNPSADRTPPKPVWTSWEPQPPHVLDAGAAVEVQFSEPVFAGVAGPQGYAWLVNQRTGRTVPLSLFGRQNNRLITFVPDAPLPQGTDFVLFMPGLRDLAGNHVTETLRFRTFSMEFVVPRSTPAGPIAVTANGVRNDLTFAGGTPLPPAQETFSFGLSKIDFVTSRPEQTPDRRWKTTLFGTGDQRESGAMYLTWDASDPSSPRAIGYSPSASRAYTALRVFKDVPVRFREPYVPPGQTQPRPDPAPLAAWRARQLWQVSADPEDRLCAAADDPRIEQWRDRVLAKFPSASISMRPGCGTLGLVGSYTTAYAVLHVVDFTDPARPFEFTRRLLSDGGALFGYARQHHAPEGAGVPRSFGLLFGLDIEHRDFGNTSATSTDTVGAYVPVNGVGLTLVDVGRIVPDILLSDRPRAQAGSGAGVSGAVVESLGLYTFPYYRAARVTSDRRRVVAVAGDKRDGTNIALLELFDPGLNAIGAPLELPAPANEVELVGGYRFDLDGDGTPEHREFAFVTTDAGIAVVDVATTQDALQLVGFIPMRTAASATQGNPVRNVSGACPALTFEAGSISYLTTVETRYVGGTCVDLDEGARVLVSGQITSAGRIRADEVRIFRTGNTVLVRRLTQIQVDAARKTGYVVAEWEQGTFRYWGIVTLDLANPTGALTDADGDGYDDRILAFTRVVGPGAPGGQAGTVEDVKFDPDRRLLYLALSPQPKDGSAQSLAILRTCRCPENTARITLRSSGLGGGSDVDSVDGSSATVYVTPQLLAGGALRVRFDVDAFAPGPFSYRVSEETATGSADDALLDLSGAGQGLATPGVVELQLPIRPGVAPVGSVVTVDFFDAEGTLIDRSFVLLAPASVQAGPARVTTFIDRINRQIVEKAGELAFELSWDARVTIRINGQVVTAKAVGLGVETPGTPFLQVPLAAGLNRIAITREMVSRPGEHPYEIRADFGEGGDFAIATGVIVHDVRIDEALPVGHTFVKGVNVATGQLSISREDLVIPGVGPTLQFQRTYSSVGTRSGGPLGAGWSHNYQSTLRVDEFGRISLSGGEGSGMRFSQLDPALSTPTKSVYKPQAGFHGRLEFTGGAYDYYTKARMRHHYELAPLRPGDEDPYYRLTFIEDPHGNRLTLTYEEDRVRTVTDAVGRSLIFTYEPKGTPAEPRLTRIDGPLDLVVTFDYDAHGNLVRATRDERVETYDYTVDQPRDRHNLVRVTDPNGNRTRYDYFQPTDTFPGENAQFQWGVDILVIPEKHELVKRVVEGEGSPEEATTVFEFDYSQHATRTVTSITDPRQTVTKYTLNPRGNVVEVRVVLPDGDNVTRMRWAYEDGIDDVYLTRKVEPNGRVITYEYDANGNMTRETIDFSGMTGYAPVRTAAGAEVSSATRTWTFDPKWNKPLTETDFEGNSITYTVDPESGHVVAMTTDPGDAPPIVKTYVYGDVTTPGGRVLRGVLRESRDGRNIATRFRAYDDFGNPVEIEDGAGNVRTEVFDARGRRRETRDTLGRRVTFDYDALDRLTRTTTYVGQQPSDPAMHSADRPEERTYFPGGQLKTLKNGLGHVTSFTYDALNRERTRTDVVTNADGATETLEVTSSYDGNGNRTRYRDARGIERRFIFDGLNRQVAEDVSAGGAWKRLSSATYDPVGNPLTVTNLHGRTTSYVLDGFYRRVEEVLPATQYGSNEPLRIRRSFDRVGNERSFTDANGRTTRTEYDGVYRVRRRIDALGQVTSYEYDPAGNLTREVRQQSGLTIEHGPYDGLNRPLASVQRFADPLTGQQVAYATTIAYLDAEHAVETTSPRGTVVREVYNGADQLIERVVDKNGLALTTQYAYDGNGNERAVKDAEGPGPDLVTEYDGLNRAIRRASLLGGVETSFYDGNGNVVRQVDRRGIVRRREYDEIDRVTATYVVESISNAGVELRTALIVYDDAASQRRVTDARGHTTIYERDGLGRDIRIVDALGRVARQEFDGVNLRAVVSRRGVRQEMDYDARDRLTEVREFDLGGQVRSTRRIQYDDAAGRRTETNRRGLQTITVMDALDRVRRVSVRHPSLATTYGAEEFTVVEQEYDAVGNLVRSVDARGNVALHEYDGANRRIRTTEAAGTPDAGTVTLTYDGVGRVLTSTDSRGTRRYGYDERHRLVREENAEGEVRSYEYDQDDNLVTVVDPKGGIHRTTYVFDEEDRLLAVDESRGGAGGVTRYQYDAKGNRTAQQDANGNLTTYEYDELDRLVATRQHLVAGTLADGTPRSAGPGGDPSSALTWQYAYDEDGNQTLTVDAEGQRVEYTHDHLDRVVRKDYSQHRVNANGSVSYPQLLQTVLTLDANGNIERVEETKRLAPGATPVVEVTQMVHDQLDRLVSSTNADGKTVQYGYDRQGLRTRVTDADNVTTLYAYDARNRLKTVVSEYGASTAATTYEYFPDGPPKKTTYPNGVVTEISYDRAQRVTTVITHRGNPGSPLSRFDYTYDAHGNRVTQVERRGAFGGAAETTTYVYDPLDRLTSVTYPNGATVTYTLAPNGNRLTEQGTDPKTLALVNRLYAYDRVNRLTAVTDLAVPVASTTFAHDRNGNAVEERVGPIVGGVIATPVSRRDLFFDIRDQLVGVGDATPVVAFDYDFAGRRTKKRTAIGEVRFFWDERAVLQEYEASSGVTQVKYTYGSELLSLTAVAGATRTRWFYAFDALGNPSDLADESGIVQAAYGFDAWGGLFRSADVTPNRRLFTQHYFDTETGFHYFGARYYDARLGRFLTQDPYTGRTGDPPSLHRYAYAHGNPLRYIDPTGYAAEEPGLGRQILDWAGGVGRGLVKGLGSVIAAPLESAVLGLADLAQVGLGYLAIEATGGKSTDEIGTLLDPVSPIGKLAARNVNSGQGAWEAARNAIKETATGIVRETVTGLVTLPMRTYRASMSGDPEKLGEALAELALSFDQIKGPVTAVAKPLLRRPGELLVRADIALDLAMRERVKKAGISETGLLDPRRERRGALTLRDAWTIAGECVGRGVSGCAVFGGLTEKSVGNLFRNLTATKSMAADRQITLKVGREVTGTKLPGDIDFAIHYTDPARKVQTDWIRAQRINQRLSARMFDDARTHGVMGEYLPDWMVPQVHKELWWAQQGLPVGSPIRAVDYWAKGIDVGGQATAPFYKNLKELAAGKVTIRKVDPVGNFEFVNPFERPTGPWLPGIGALDVIGALDRLRQQRAQQEK